MSEIGEEIPGYPENIRATLVEKIVPDYSSVRDLKRTFPVEMPEFWYWLACAPHQGTFTDELEHVYMAKYWNFLETKDLPLLNDH